MKRDFLEKFSSVASISSVFIALWAVVLELGLANKIGSPLFKIMLGATAAAAFGAFTKIIAERKKPKKDRGRIFLIYAKEDKERIESLYEELKESGFKPWLDTKEILPGQDWKQSIKRAIEESDIALACISKNSLTKKGFVQAELKMALDLLEERSKGFSPVIPVRLEETEVPDRLKNLQWIDLFKNDNAKKLRTAIEKAAAIC
jgi:hypothetical protein